MVTFVEIEKCPLCKERITEDRALPCLHSFCKACLETQLSGSSSSRITCEVCTSTFPLGDRGVDGLSRFHFTTNHLAHRKVTSEKDALCDACKQDPESPADVPAHGFCVSCSEFYCEPCFRAHKRARITKDHIFQTVEEGCKTLNSTDPSVVNTARPSKCRKHPQYDINIFCDSCRELTCAQCAANSHSGHTFIPLDSISLKFKAEINRALDEVKRRQPPLDEAIDKTKRITKEIDHNEEECEKNIRAFIKMFVEALNVAEFKLIAGLRDIKAKKSKKIQNQREDLELNLKAINSGVQIVETLLRNGTNVEIGMSKAQVLDRLEVLQNLQYVLEPVIDSVINFDSSKSNLVLGAIKEFGTIVTNDIDLSPQNTYLDRSLLPEVTPSNKSVSLKIIPFDSKGKRVQVSGSFPFLVEVQSPSGQSTQANVENPEDGTFTVSLTPTDGGRHSIRVTLRGDEVKGSPVEFSVEAPAPRTRPARTSTPNPEPAAKDTASTSQELDPGVSQMGVSGILDLSQSQAGKLILIEHETKSETGVTVKKYKLTGIYSTVDELVRAARIKCKVNFTRFEVVDKKTNTSKPLTSISDMTDEKPTLRAFLEGP